MIQSHHHHHHHHCDRDGNVVRHCATCGSAADQHLFDGLCSACHRRRRRLGDTAFAQLWGLSTSLRMRTPAPKNEEDDDVPCERERDLKRGRKRGRRGGRKHRARRGALLQAASEAAVNLPSAQIG